MTPQTLSAITGIERSLAAAWAEPVTVAMDRYGINTPLRIAHFMAQVAHESGGFQSLEEDLYYNPQRLAQVWPGRFAIDPAQSPAQPNVLAMSVARNPQALAEVLYGKNKSLGNTQAGDGWRFHGRGLIQLTGRDNYTRCAAALGIELLDHPELLLVPKYAALAAGWFWQNKGLNQLSDQNAIINLTKRVNGGTVGLADRVARFDSAYKVLTA